MSADNEIIIGQFHDCWAVTMTFASHWWPLMDTPANLRDEHFEAEVRREFTQHYKAKTFKSESEAETYAWDWEEKESIVEYGTSYEVFDFSLNLS